MTESPAPPVPALLPAARLPADRNPALVYLASLAPGDGRRSMAAALAQVSANKASPGSGVSSGLPGASASPDRRISTRRRRPGGARFPAADRTAQAQNKNSIRPPA